MNLGSKQAEQKMLICSRKSEQLVCLKRLQLTVKDSRLLTVLPDDHSKVVPPLPIPNRTVKRLCADDSDLTVVKVGHRQAPI